MATLHIDAQLHRGDFDFALQLSLTLDGMLGVLGPSGAGKTTLLRIIAGLEEGAVGRVQLDDSHWQDSGQKQWVPPHQRGLGYVFQDARLLPHLSVRDNLEYAVKRSRQPDNTPPWDDVVAALSIEGLLARSPSTLSGGEQQRVAIARALLSGPRLLLMDEPLSGTDIERRGELLPFLRDVVERFAVPVIYVSHSLSELSMLCDQLLVLRAGRAVALGPTATILQRLDLGEVSDPAEAVSVLEAAVVDHDSDYDLTRLSLSGQFLWVPMEPLAVNSVLRLRVHARDVALAVTRPEGISVRNILEGVVKAVAPDGTGPGASVLVDVDGQIVRSRVTRQSVDQLALAPGSAVYALVKAASVEAD